jgi:hypothetical protein
MQPIGAIGDGRLADNRANPLVASAKQNGVTTSSPPAAKGSNRIGVHIVARGEVGHGVY